MESDKSGRRVGVMLGALWGSVVQDVEEKRPDLISIMRQDPRT